MDNDDRKHPSVVRVPGAGWVVRTPDAPGGCLIVVLPPAREDPAYQRFMRLATNQEKPNA